MENDPFVLPQENKVGGAKKKSTWSVEKYIACRGAKANWMTLACDTKNHSCIGTKAQRMTLAKALKMNWMIFANAQRKSLIELDKIYLVIGTLFICLFLAPS